jgi:hypothetical protein
LLLGHGFDGIEALGVGFFAEDDQLFGTGRKAKAAGLAPFAVHDYSAHLKKPRKFIACRQTPQGRGLSRPPIQSNTMELF